MKKAVLLNDTSYENHHGCSIVIDNIRKELLARDIHLLATNPIGKNWRQNQQFLKALTDCDIVIVNAEGTIHHNSPYAFTLLQIVEAVEVPAILMNMTYQDNSEAFANLVRRFSKVYVRESMSQAELAVQGIFSEVVADMTFASSYEFAIKRNNDIYITDSHDIRLSEKLYRLAKKLDMKFMPIISPYRKHHSLKGLVKKIKFLSIYKFRLISKYFFMQYYSYLRHAYVEEEKKIVQNISECKILFTARYHALCIALQTNTPFLALKSNTHKIEGILKDVGIDLHRIIAIDEVEKWKEWVNSDGSKFHISEMEKERILFYLKKARKDISNMFDAIAAL